MFEKHKSYIPAVILMLILKLLSPTSQAEQANTSGFDFSAYDSVLKTFVNEKAMVNYRMLKAQRRRLDAFVAALGKLPRRTYEKWDDKHKIAFWLNAYNGLTLKAIIDNYPIKSSFLRSRFWPKNSIRQIPGVWKKLKFTVMGSQVTLWHIEHEILRKKFDEPRIHMAMVCAAMGCPPLRGEPYEGGKLDEQLDDQTRRFLADSGKFKIDSRKGTVHLSEIFKCFAEDLLSMVESLDVGLRLMFHPPEAMSELRRWLGDRHNYRPQSGDDLGARLKSAFVGAFEEGFSKVVAIGSDSPDLPGAPVELNADKVMAHVRAVVQADADGHPPETLEAEGIDVLFGAGRFLDANNLMVGEREISSNKFIICTGSHPFVPPIPGLEEIPYLTNERIFDVETLPKSMIVLGAGPIGIELSAALNRLGVKMTVVQRSAAVLKRDDPELVGRLVEILRAEGVELLTETRTTGFSRRDNRIIADIEDKQGRRQIEAESVLISVGRRPNLEGLDLQRAGVEFDSAGIKVDKNLRTTAKNIYACGDVVPPYLFTHIAEYEAIIAATNASLPVPIKKTNYDNVLWATYTDPELAHAGLTEQQARDRYGDAVRIYRWEHRDVDRAKTDLASNGLSKFICDTKGRLLGIHILGHGAAELMHEAQVVKSLGLPFTRIASIIHAYPSYSDAVRQPAKRCYLDVLQNRFFIKLLKKLKPGKDRV